ncbi:MAG TPA: DUF4382 domain-containing protein [Fimbriimonadaceae bacterium]|nr:DUF4382 domain-containing protein [Fimbriimonadaceae bacterium]
MKKLTLWMTILACITAISGLGCGGSGSNPFTGGNGTLAVRLADAPDPTITDVDVNIDRVEANIGGQWQVITDADQTVDLMDLVHTDLLLGQALVPAGRYNQVRLIVTSGSVTDEDGTHNLLIPSGIQTGIKINLNFDVPEGDTVEVLLDFNVQKSIVKQGNGVYRLQPVIPAVVKITSGTISGTVTDGSNVLNNATVRATYTAGTNYPLGTVVNETSSISDGTFRLWALKAGTYSLTFTWTDPNNPNITLTDTVADVVVVATQNTDVGTVTLN